MFTPETLRSKWSAFLFLEKLIIWQLVSLGERRTVKSEWYTVICFHKVFGEIIHSFVIHQGKAQLLHISSKNRLFKKIELVARPMHCGDSASNDFILFWNNLRRKRFSFDRRSHSCNQKTMFWRCLKRYGKKCFDNWFEQINAQVYWSLIRIFWKTINDKLLLSKFRTKTIHIKRNLLFVCYDIRYWLSYNDILYFIAIVKWNQLISRTKANIESPRI